MNISGDKTGTTKELPKKLLRQAQNSGVLNLCNRALGAVPDSVWDLNTPIVPDDGPTIDFKDPDAARWWEIQPIRRLLLSSNQLTTISGPGLVKLASITQLDLRDNLLTNLPDELGDLVELRSLNLSTNQLKQLPVSINRLTNLEALDLTNNQLTGLGQDLSDLCCLSRLDASNNKLESLPSQWPGHLRQVDLSHNALTSLPSGLLVKLPALSTLELNHNRITELTLDDRVPSVRSGSQLIRLDAAFNKLTRVPDVASFKFLKELILSDNHITEFTLDRLADTPALLTLDVARNQLTELPSTGIKQSLPSLVRLDLSSNELTSLPTELGFMDKLQVLLVDRNQLRSIRHNVLSAGTEALKDLLRMRHHPSPANDDKQQEESVVNKPHPQEQPPSTTSHPSEPSSVPVQSASSTTASTKSEEVKSPPASSKRIDRALLVDQLSELNLPHASPAGLLDWSGPLKPIARAEATSLPPSNCLESWSLAASPTHASSDVVVKKLLLDRRLLDTFPSGIYAFASTLVELCLSRNRLIQIPDEIECLTKLNRLELDRNLLTAIPVSLSRLAKLDSLCFDNNPLGPTLSDNAPVFVEPLATRLRHLSLRGCKLTSCPSPKLLHPNNMPSLCHLDLSDNELATLPPQLGLCTQLKSLQVEGNLFRIPRPNIIARGTSAILEDLARRVPAE